MSPIVWAKFDDKYSEHPKIEAAGPWAELLDMRAIIYACRNETDGAISQVALAKIGAGIPKVKSRAEKLVEVGRWLPNEIGGGWWIHSFLDYNPSRAQLSDHREKGKQRAKRSRERNANEQANATRTYVSGSGDPYAGASAGPRARANGSGISVEKLSAIPKSVPPWVAAGLTRSEWLEKGRTA